MAPALFSFVGYDLEVVSELTPTHQRRLGRLCRWFLLPSLCMGGSTGAFVWLVERAALPALLLSLFVGLVVHNLLRLVVAGGGAAPHLTKVEVEAWAPTLPPLLILGGMALCFAQPVQLLVYGAALDERIEDYRQQLGARHSAGSATPSVHASSVSGSTDHRDGQLGSSESYRRRLAACYFATRRLALLWHVPEGPLAFTFLFCALCTSPLLLSHTRYLPSLRAYELARWLRVRRQLLLAEQETQRELSHSLGAFVRATPPASTRANEETA